jgi:YidC/Oxa1 family membrane protein insertase
MLGQEPENQKNLLLAIVLSIGVLLAWQFFYASPKLKDEQERQKRAQQQTTEQQGGGAPTVPGAGGQVPAVPGISATPKVTREAALGESPRRLPIDTPSLSGSIALKGGRIDDLQLVKYHETVDPKSPKVVLFSPASAPEPYFAEYGWVAAPGTGFKVPDRDTEWRVEGPAALAPNTPVTLAWDNGQGLKFRRTIAVDADYMFKITDAVENTSGSEVTLFPYARVYRYGTPVGQGTYILHEGAIGVLGDAGLQELSYSDLQKEGGGKSFEKATGGWVGFTDKYWAAALIPDQGQTYRASMSGKDKKRTGTDKEEYQTDYQLAPVVVPAGTSTTISSQLFAGAKQVQLIDAYKERYNIAKFDLMIDWGWFWYFTKPLFYLMDWLYRHLGNFGLAILALTLIVKVLFFPLANKSYESMAKMKKLQPEMEKLRERFKDDKMRQQQELMALYKKQKVNPLAGCLPIAIQIPVFFALYKVLFVTIDMRHAPFFGWIRDLSAPDPTSLFNLFGLLPIPPVEAMLLGHTLGAWPLVMGVTMWLQMQLNPQQPDPVQQQIFNWMPVMFTFLLAGFSSGLVIYWAWNNTLSITQQYWIMRRNGVDNHLAANLKKKLAPVLRFFERVNGRSKA